MNIKCIIVDDEKGAHNILKNYIERQDNILLCGAFYNAVEAYQFLSVNKTDLVILDIQMPEVDGFTLLDMLKNRPFVIFCSAYSDFALKGYEYDAVDYLQKPFRYERFAKAMDKARAWCKIAQEDLNENRQFIEIKNDGNLIQLATPDIQYIESLGNYVKVHSTKKEFMTLMPLSKIEQELPVNHFVRIHKSYLVNTQYIKTISGRHVILDTIKLPIGNTYRKYVLDVYKKQFL